MNNKKWYDLHFIEHEIGGSYWINTMPAPETAHITKSGGDLSICGISEEIYKKIMKLFKTS